MAVLVAEIAAASAGTVAAFIPMPVPFWWEGWCWGYRTTEANADNTLDWALGSDGDDDGTYDNAVLYTNGNPNGLLDSTAVGRFEYNTGDAASGGGAAIAITPTAQRIGAFTVRANLITAGTGTVPAIMFGIIGKYLQPFR
jgi:hypothetical protein